MPGKILVVDSRTPTPDQDSGSASTFSYLQILSRAGFEITFAPGNLARVEPYTSDIEKLGIRTLARPEWSSLSTVIEAFGPLSDILLFYRVDVASRIFDLAREKAPDAKIIFHPVDLHFLRQQRQAQVTGKIAECAEKIASVRKIELGLLQRADAAIVVSTTEYNLVRELVPEANVHQIPILREQPTNQTAQSNSRFFKKNFHKVCNFVSGRPSELAGRRDILFVGGFEHQPNVDAVNWFVTAIWPKILQRGFRHRLVIVGSKATPEILALASKKIRVKGYVKDLAPVLERCRLSVAPLRYGGGIKGKIVTSLSHGLPVVATSVAAEGMTLQHGKNILIADTPEDIVDSIFKIYSSDQLWLDLSTNGREAFEEKFSHAAGAPKLVALCNNLLVPAPKEDATVLCPAD